MATFKPPFTEVDVDGVRLRVRWVRTLPRFRAGYAQGGDYGDLVIRIAWGSATRRGLRSAFAHELMHYFVERDGGIPKANPRAQEEAVCGMAEWFAIVLATNPRVAEWLAEQV